MSIILGEIPDEHDYEHIPPAQAETEKPRDLKGQYPMDLREETPENISEVLVVIERDLEVLEKRYFSQFWAMRRVQSISRFQPVFPKSEIPTLESIMATMEHIPGIYRAKSQSEVAQEYRRIKKKIEKFIYGFKNYQDIWNFHNQQMSERAKASRLKT